VVISEEFVYHEVHEEHEGEVRKKFMALCTKRNEILRIC
jgi:hypothetical protein